MKKFFKKYWHVVLTFLLFGIAAALDPIMDHINFRFPHDSGFWSIHTNDQIDAWHIAKKIKWTLLIICVVGVKRVLHKSGKILFVTFALINYIFHEVLLHKILKRKKKGNG